jgi:hypothetical protein
MNTRNLEEQIIAASLGYDRDAAEILLACRAAGFPNAVITYPEHGLRRLIHAIQHDSDPTLTAQLDAVDAYTDEANKVLDALNERVPFAEPPAETTGIDWLDAGEQADLLLGCKALDVPHPTRGLQIIVTKSFAERWTSDPKHYRDYYRTDNIQIDE